MRRRLTSAARHRLLVPLWVICLWTLGRTAPARADLIAGGPPRFDNVSQGAIADFGFGSGEPGYSLIGELGAESTGIKTVGDNRWLLQWDALLAARGGVLANAHPYLALLGAHTGGYVELGNRLLPNSAVSPPWSPYVGARLAGDVQILVPPGHSLSSLDTLNDMDGVGGLNLTGAARVAGGASYLRGAQSLLLELFVQEALRAPAVYTPGAEFSGVGIAARFDIARSLFLDVDLFWGWSVVSVDAALNEHNQPALGEVTASFRKVFSNGMWLGADVSLLEESYQLVFLGGGRAYYTWDAPTFEAAVTYGFPLGRQE